MKTESAEPSSYWYPLFEHLSKQYGLTLIDSELQEIAMKVDESREKGGLRNLLKKGLEEELK